MKRIVYHHLILPILLILSGCTGENSLTDENDCTELIIQASTTSFTHSQSSSAASRATEDGYTTHFVTGDAIGLFAIRSGAVQADANNRKLVYTTTGSWTFDDGGTLFYASGTTYVAYYPYQTGITITATTATAAVTALTSHSSLQPKSNQSALADYAASDLMTAIATPQDASAGKKTLTFAFTHCFALLTLDVRGQYVAPQGAGYSYRGEINTDIKTVILGGKVACKINNSFRAIVPSSTALTGSYTTLPVRQSHLREIILPPPTGNTTR